jgi:hypothetical protein
MARWIQTKWRFEELQGKSVEFELKSPTREFKGQGRFQVFKKSDGRLWILIQPSAPVGEKLHLVLDERAASAISPAQDTHSADFICCAA